jgi:hypothetical protein
MRRKSSTNEYGKSGTLAQYASVDLGVPLVVAAENHSLERRVARSLEHDGAYGDPCGGFARIAE